MRKAIGTSEALMNDEEISRLLESMFNEYGYDFRQYAMEHIKRRVLQRMRLDRLDSVDVMRNLILHNPAYAEILLKDLSINVTEMFRNPAFYRTLREKVVPLLRTWSFIRLWHAGCSTGEEVYSMAILLKEEGLYDRTQIYATDFNQQALRKASEGIYTAEQMKKYARNYLASGAMGVFSDYYSANYDSAIVNSSLRKNIVWANHNLVTDSDFAETQMVMCRNVMIYFNKELQNKVHALFHRSLVNGGILCLGDKETLDFLECSKYFESLDKRQKIYRKRYILNN